MNTYRRHALRASLALGVIAALFLTGCSCSVSAWVHEPGMAAESAEAFARVAFIEGDREAAYELTGSEFQAEIPTSDFANALGQLHPNGWPTSGRAIEYQLTPGYRGMLIYLEGESGQEHFYYRFVMAGTATSSYAVVGLFRGSGVYPDGESRVALR